MRQYLVKGLALLLLPARNSSYHVLAAAHAAGQGSWALQLGSNERASETTTLIARLQVELSTPDPATPDKGSVQVTVECSSCASPEFKVGTAH